MSYAYDPSVGYGPLRLGMSPAEVEALLGKPASLRWPFESIPIDAETRRMTKHVRVMDFPDQRKNNDRPQVTFDRNKAVSFTLFNRKDPVVAGLDLFDADRDGVLRELAAREGVYYEHREQFFFPRAAVCVPKTKYARRLPYIVLIDAPYQLARLDFDLLDPSTALSD
jgi:hypothetical protein